MKNNNIYGTLYFFIHFIIEITTFYIVTFYTNSNIVWIIALIYDFFAFVPQGIFGYFKDKGFKIDFTLLGLIISSIALILFHYKISVPLLIFILAIGNAMVHVEGAQMTLRSSPGKMTPSALFVSGGSFGVITGKILSMYNVNIAYVLIINLLIMIFLMISYKYKKLIKEDNLKKYNYSNKKVNSKVIIILATFVVIVRAYMGYGIPTTWNKTLFQTILLFCFMGVGKALGGILIDKKGIRFTALVSTIGSLPFLLFGDNIMIISLIGVMLFSMTMAITLGLIVSVLKQYPGVAFGFTTLGLFIGSLPIFVFKINSLLINCIMISILTLTCVIILMKICRKESN